MRACEECSKSLPKDAGPRKRFCQDCVDERRRQRQRTKAKPNRNCIECGQEFKPYHDGQITCGQPDCQRSRVNEKRRRTEQNDRLFRKWDQRESIRVDDLVEGTRLVALSDTQFPFVDEPLLRSVNRFIKDWKPNEIVYNGDIVDFYEISSFDRNPHRQFRLVDEIEMAADMLREHRRLAPNARQWWLDGNHEQRLERYIARQAPELAELMPTIEEVLKFDEYEVRSVPYGKFIDFHGFAFTHGNFVSQYSGYTARRHYDKYHSSGANGHTHRMGSYSHTDMHGRSHTWVEMGCLCRTDLEYTRGIPNWQQGFITARVHKGALVPTSIHVIETDAGRFFIGPNEKAYDIFD